ncbi:MAG TPA: hypothetical protein DEB17_07685 [Chlorobaculum sp.]|uniref:Uncharacterized protein n=1 Tax=Chlorobaculum tepidum (strain ATCC 49652 / DSM 12025 / NBRC 103806 / TLS) TaxID=194439 RepID=Q8KFE5_CHLTE|nr:hypothetical protein CT0382 [Chlorobaculum tepidum TLS]HBU23854.1 hypothetical protein [Chlorobaculum sp.]
MRTDKLYRTRENRNWSKKRGIRDAVKGNFGQAQQRYGPFGQEQHDGGLGHFSGDESGSAVQPAFLRRFEWRCWLASRIENIHRIRSPQAAAMHCCLSAYRLAWQGLIINIATSSWACSIDFFPDMPFEAWTSNMTYLRTDSG